MLVDALVGLLVLSTVLGLSFLAMQTAHAVAGHADEARRAAVLIRARLAGAPASLATESGDTDGFAWTVTTAVTSTVKPVAVCARQASLRGDVSGRRYAAATLVTCPVESP